MKNFRSNRQAGFSLIELLLVLAIIAALAVAAFVIYPRVQAGRSATYESQVLSSAQASVKALYTSSNYDTLTDTVALNADFFPSNMADGSGGLKNEWDGAVTIGPSASDGGAATAAGTADRYFKITYASVPSAVCVKLAASIASNFGTVIIDGNTVQDTYSATTTTLDEANIASYCTGASSVGMVFVSN